jgi:hypothetical protein
MSEDIDLRLGEILGPLKQPAIAPAPGWARGFAARAVALAGAELERRRRSLAWWQLLVRWPSPLVPAVAAVLALVLALGPARLAGPRLPASESEFVLTGEPLDLVFDDPVLELVRPAAGSGEWSGE